MNRISKEHVRVALLCAALLGGGALSALATMTPAITYPSRGGSSNLGGYTLGWEFTTDRAIAINALGIWDQSGDGNTIPHQVGIWDANTNLLLSATVSISDNTITSPGGSATEFYLYHEIPTYDLPAGTYRIGGYVGGDVAGGGSSTADGWHQAPIGLAVATGITLGHAYDNNLNTSLAFPYRDDGTLPYAGPNFLFSEIPEPSTLILIAAGGLLLQWRVWRRA